MSKDEIDEKLRTLLKDIADLLEAIAIDRRQSLSVTYGVTASPSADAVGNLSNKKTLTVAEAAKYLGVSTPLVYTLIHRTDFPTLRVGRRVIIPREQLDKWIDEHINENLF